MSYLFRALYNYKNRYLLNASFRRDGSSVFYKTGNTWDNFYSFGAGWVMTEEKFMQNQNVINFLKLKGSWGVLGSQNTVVPVIRHMPPLLVRVQLCSVTISLRVKAPTN